MVAASAGDEYRALLQELLDRPMTAGSVTDIKAFTELGEEPQPLPSAVSSLYDHNRRDHDRKPGTKEFGGGEYGKRTAGGK